VRELQRHRASDTAAAARDDCVSCQESPSRLDRPPVFWEDARHATLAEQLQDWNQLGRYYAANEELKKQPADPKRVAVMGDSITGSWNLATSFPSQPYVNRGISGQTTPQMLVRMYADVTAHKPAAVVILAGTNAIARNTGPSTLEQIGQNFMAMTELAQGHGIKVVLCAVTDAKACSRTA
jgi:hypothetical protein